MRNKQAQGISCQDFRRHGGQAGDPKVWFSIVHGLVCLKKLLYNKNCVTNNQRRYKHAKLLTTCTVRAYKDGGYYANIGSKQLGGGGSQ